MTVTEALESLGLAPDARPTATEVRDAYYAAARVCHPDAGGDDSAFERLTAARDVLKKRLTQVRKCEACGGTGSTDVWHGFYVTKKRCRPCHGTGQVTGW